MNKKYLLRSLIIISLLALCAGALYLATGRHSRERPHPSGYRDSYDPGRVYTKPAVTYAPAGHIICMLGKGRSIRAISGGMLRDRLLIKYFPFIEGLPVVKGGGAINYEELMKAAPDIVFIDPELANDDRAIKKIKLTGIDYAVFSFNSMEDQINAVKKIGSILGNDKTARLYEDFYRNSIRLTAERLAGLAPGKRKHIYHSILEVNRTDGKNTLGSDWVRAAGLVNISDSIEGTLSEDKFFISVEEIIAWDPEIIFVNESEAETAFLTSDKFSSLKAVRNGAVYKMPNGISRWGHPTSFETPLAILWTAMKSYPDRFRDTGISSSIKKFYREFFSIGLDDHSVEKILKGKGMRHGKHSRKHRRH